MRDASRMPPSVGGRRRGGKKSRRTMRGALRKIKRLDVEMAAEAPCPEGKGGRAYTGGGSFVEIIQESSTGREKGLLFEYSAGGISARIFPLRGKGGRDLSLPRKKKRKRMPSFFP